MTKATRKVAELRNLGPTSSQWLNIVGIFTEADLAHVGSIIAFRIVKEAGFPATANLLYALEAAILDIDWRTLDSHQKERLRREAGLD